MVVGVRRKRNSKNTSRLREFVTKVTRHRQVADATGPRFVLPDRAVTTLGAPMW